MDAPFPDGMVEAIEGILATDAVYKDGQDLYPHIFENAFFMPLQRKNEMQQMMRIARSVPHSTVMEVGADKGGGVYHWVKALQPERMIGVEIRGTPYAHVFDRTFPLVNFCWLAGSSYDPAVGRQIRDWLRGHLIDILFLDGDKAAYYRDFEMYVPMMTRGGYVFMHDIQDDAPGEAFRMASVHPQVAHAWEIIDTNESEMIKRMDARGMVAIGPYDDWLRYWAGRSCGVGVMQIRT
jgi:hypothetical protein